jgi:hypothetical protein
MATADVLRDATDSILTILRAGIPAAMVDPARIVAATPDDFGDYVNPDHPALTLFLYRIAVNPQMRNEKRRTLPDGRVQRQPLPLELCYLITAWARDTADELLILGRVLQVLYECAELGPANLVGAAWEPGEGVQLVLETLGLDDHYRIWDAANVPYRLSLTYMARVVGISPLPGPMRAPVLDAMLGVRA